MGGITCREPEPEKRPRTDVVLNVYSITQSEKALAVNEFLRPFGTGAYHCGVEVYGWEWSYGEVKYPFEHHGQATGVFPCPPRRCEGHTFIEEVNMGCTRLSRSEVSNLLAELMKEWPVAAYETIKHNCCHFSQEFLNRLGVADIPQWVMHLPGVLAGVEMAAQAACCSSCHRDRAQEDRSVISCCRTPSRDDNTDFLEAQFLSEGCVAARAAVNEGDLMPRDKTRLVVTKSAFND